MWELIGEHIGNTSIFGSVPLVAVAMVAVNMALTVVHAGQERQGKLWRYFGAIYGFKFPDTLGFLLFFLGLTLVLWAVAIVGIAGPLPLLGVGARASQAWEVGAIGVLIGARLADSWKSHIELSRNGFRPNPGLTSTPLYIAEAVALAVVFAPGLAEEWRSALFGLLLGAGFFWLVVPGFLRALASVCPRHEPWIRGRSIPCWAAV